MGISLSASLISSSASSGSLLSASPTLRYRLFLIVATFAIGGGIGLWLWWSTLTQPEESFPPVSQLLSLKDVEGVVHPPSKWQGKVQLINFWATWCTPCRQEIPLFASLYSRWQERGLVVVGIAIDEVDAVRRFGDEVGINYPSLIAGKDGLGLLARFGGGQGLPYSLLVDRKGNIVERKLGMFRESEIEALIESYIGPG